MINFDIVIKEETKEHNQIGQKFMIINTEY